MYDIMFISSVKDSSDFKNLQKKYPLIKQAKTLKEAAKKSFTKMFWVVWSDINVLDSFKFDKVVHTWDEEYVHVFKNGNDYTGILLVSKKLAMTITDREIDYRFFINKKEWDILASTPKLYDKFIVDSYDEYLHALNNTTTPLFWIIPFDVSIHPDFKFDLYFNYENTYDRNQTHAFVHLEEGVKTYNRVFLCSKSVVLSKKEIEYKFPVDRKEWDIIASTPKLYDKFIVDSYDEYLYALNNTTTPLFWIMPSDVQADENFKFDLYFNYENTYDRNQTHAFVHLEEGNRTYNRVFLCSKSVVLSKKEIDHKFPVARKEWDIIASTPKLYDKFIVDSYDEYLYALNNTTTSMFWIIPFDVSIHPDFKFDLYFNYENTYDRNQTHAFVHLEEGNRTYNRVFLCSKSVVLSKKEIDHKFPVARKEWDIIASTPKLYDKFIVNDYDDYLTALAATTTPLFWIIPSDVNIDDDFKFDLYFNYDNTYDRGHTHAFAHINHLGIKLYNQIFLCSKSVVLSKKEIDHRFPIDRKEWDIVASRHKNYDIVFISYNELNAYTQLHALKTRFPAIKHVHNVQGIHNAHIAAAKLVDTKMFWVIDADAEVLDDFNFDYVAPNYDIDAVHTWKSINPVNGLIYGYGGVKLLPTKATIQVDTNTVDMTTSISPKFKVMDDVSNITRFNTSPFNAWKSAFRECVKLSSKEIDRQIDDQTADRLNIWCTVGGDKTFGNYVLQGAIAGRQYGFDNAGNKAALSKINDFEWLLSQFKLLITNYEQM